MKVLQKYRQKRKFNQTPEPEGKKNPFEKHLQFVVQKHAASHLHYDFRLELDGVLKSWAIPKGPSMNPNDKRLAIMVEDHPLEYGAFEGVIPEGNYGAGTVMIWDKGHYHSIDQKKYPEEEKSIKAGLAKGHISFILSGEKLKGEFSLIRLRNLNKNEWLLIKKNDQFASKNELNPKGNSALRKRKIQKAEDSDHKTKMPHHVKPMLATLVKDAFNDKDWIFEIKWDGYRTMAEIDDKHVEIYSRSLNSFNTRFSPIVESLKKLKMRAILDGEIVVVDQEGKSQFHLLQNYQNTGEGNLIYYVFDLIYLNGKDLSQSGLLERKKILKEILPALYNVKYSGHIQEHGLDFFEEAKKHDIEGIIGKNKTSVYRPGVRSKEWLKMKNHLQQEVVIAGFTEPKGGRKHFGSLVLGVYENDKLQYIGHSGGGFDEKALVDVISRLKPLIRKTSPFKIPPKTNMPANWVKPQLVGEVSFQEWTPDGRMRIPVFLGLREDKNAKEVKREYPETNINTRIKKKKTPTTHVFENNGHEHFEKAEQKSKKNDLNILLLSGKKNQQINIEGHTLALTNLDKIFWEEEKFTKSDLINYYQQIAPYILPYLKDRPESLNRHPNGIKGKSFFQKNVGDSIPEWIETVKIYSESNNKEINYLLCQNKATLVYLANLACIELNPWSSRVGNLEYPDYAILDLDPLNISFDKVIETAQAIKEVLKELKIMGYCKTSGASGLHIYIPVGAKYNYEQVRQFAQLIAKSAHEVLPEITSLERLPKKRDKRVYIDFLQNSYGQTLAAPYCIRPRPGATVSMPLLWEEVRKGLSPSDFTIKNAFNRIKKNGDIFHAVLEKGIDMVACLSRLEKL